MYNCSHQLLTAHTIRLWSDLQYGLVSKAYTSAEFAHPTELLKAAHIMFILLNALATPILIKGLVSSSKTEIEVNTVQLSVVIVIL